MSSPEWSAAMREAVGLARLGVAAPNPHVGALVVRDGHVIGRGFHARAGAPHAEVIALREAGEAARGATLVCSLEPCCHHGRTPPCTEAILAAGISRVVFGCSDPKRHVDRTGAEVLRHGGVEVVGGVELDACRELIADFASVVLRGRPRVIVKAATSLDGRTATRTGDSKWITSEAARRHAHGLRATVDAIAVGIGTVLADDPELTVRHGASRTPAPRRVVFDRDARTPLESRLVRSAREVPTVVLHAEGALGAGALAARGVHCLPVPGTARGVEIAAALHALAGVGVNALLVEGGATLHGALLDADVVDAVALYVAPVLLGEGAPMAAWAQGVERVSSARKLVFEDVQRLGSDVLLRAVAPPLTW